MLPTNARYATKQALLPSVTNAPAGRISRSVPKKLIESCMPSNYLPFPSNFECDDEHDIDCECSECEDAAEMAYLDREEAIATKN
jgi:hypothetical protein